MKYTKSVFLCLLTLVPMSCIDYGSGTVGAFSIDYELPSKALGPGVHGMPSHYAHTTDGLFTDWDPALSAWNQEWSDATLLLLKTGEENKEVHILFDRDLENKRDHVLIAMPMEIPQEGASCGILLQGSNDSFINTWSLWSGILSDGAPSSFSIHNDQNGNAVSSASWGPSPLSSTAEESYLIAEVSLPAATGTQKWVLSIPTTNSCEVWEPVVGFEAIVQTTDSHHTLLEMTPGSVAYYAPSYLSGSPYLHLFGTLLEAMTVTLDANPVEVDTVSNFQAYFPMPMDGSGVLTNQNTAGKTESIPLVAHQGETPRNVLFFVHPTQLPLTLDGIFSADEYPKEWVFNHDSFQIFSSFNGEVHQSWVEPNATCENLTATPLLSLTSPLCDFSPPSNSPLESVETHAPTEGGGLELRSWRGNTAAGRSWRITCDPEEGPSLLIEHANHSVGALLGLRSEAPIVSTWAVSWDQSALDIQGDGFGEKTDDSKVVWRDPSGNTEELPLLEWSTDAISIALPAEGDAFNGMVLITTDTGSTTGFSF